jgi:cytoskeletal protein CcmA (bactofilin family)
MDYAAAKSTMCRQCGSSFAPNAPKPGLKLRPKEEVAPEPEPTGLRKIEGLWNRQRSRVVACFECKRKHEVSEAATSTNCPGCSAHIDLRDYKITTSFSRSIRTRGDLHLTSKGDLSSTSVICRNAIIEGRLRGNLQCSDSATISFVGKIPGRLTAHHVTLEKKSEVQFFRRVRVSSIDIKGKMSGEVVAETVVKIHSKAMLDGNVTAKSIVVEKDGIFSGQLVIGKADLAQAELLPDQKAAAPSESAAESAPETAAPVAHPLPAT